MPNQMQSAALQAAKQRDIEDIDDAGEVNDTNDVRDAVDRVYRKYGNNLSAFYRDAKKAIEVEKCEDRRPKRRGMHD